MRRVRIRIRRLQSPGMRLYICTAAGMHVMLGWMEEMHGWRFRPEKPFMGSSHAGLRWVKGAPPPTAAPGRRPTTRLPLGSAFNKGDGSLRDSCFQPSTKPLYLSLFRESLESECSASSSNQQSSSRMLCCWVSGPFRQPGRRQVQIRTISPLLASICPGS